MKHQLSGMRDLTGEKYRIREEICKLFALNLEKFCYSPIELPIIENLDLYKHTSGDTSDIVSKELYIVKTLYSDESSLVLRPEATASVVRAAVNLNKWQEKCSKFYYIGPMFRHNRPQKGRYRQFMQCGCEVLKPSDCFVKAENIIMLTRFLESIDVPFILHLNCIPEDMSAYIKNVRKYFESRLDLLSDINRQTLNRNPLRVMDQLSQDSRFDDVPKSIDFLNVDEKKEFDKILKILKQYKVGYTINHKLVRGLDYYVGVVFELIHDNLALGGGGGYKMAGSRFDLKQDIYGFGWGIGLDRIEDLTNVTLAKKEIYLVISIDCDDYAFEVTMRLRSENKSAILHLCGVKKGLEFAKKLNLDHKVQIVFIGESEKNTDSFIVKTWQD